MVLQIAQVVAAALAGGGFAAAVNAWLRRPVTRAEAVERLNDSTLEWAESLKRDAGEARRDAREARNEAAEVRQQVSTLRMETEQLVGYLRWIIRSIHDPAMDIERLRALVGNGPDLPPADDRRAA